MGNFFNKPKWSEIEWEIYFRNLDLIRARHGLKKGEFAEKAGIRNAYRTDVNRPDKTIFKIAKAFNVDVEWLCSDHSKEEIEAFLCATNDEENAIINIYDNPRLRSHAIEMLLEVLDSGNQSLINAIIANLEAFSGAVRNEMRQRQEIEDLKRRIEALERSRAGARETPEPESNAA
ncbi:MAG: helix-turn-helix transcriptional regulator [Deltaproteobacteria bacterium]|nr:helix-turn-helix transcriptional regulator [Deltaproteobacteria bacterium]MBW2025707.1 helix-turn-helix transcriptional regulator [Deltaproteobacteria bacterium]MBW2124248.1 helix-turn-helix transcriptional regulator [Deltaproteobacteria bacterium]